MTYLTPSYHEQQSMGGRLVPVPTRDSPASSSQYYTSDKMWMQEDQLQIPLF